MSRAIHCDLPGCDVWALDEMSEHWITVSSGYGADSHYCDGWHAAQHLATVYEPSMVVPT